ncbi:MAG: hypothetical protein JRE81_10115 [Deltaproteobacteria bacterium]|nr:hypothetical protein [Deltaproteobacteria bacterium]
MSAFCSLGCGDGDGGGDAGAGGQGGSDLVPASLYVFEFDPIPLESPIEGAAICQVGADNCVRSDRLGWATIYFPAGQEIAFTVEKEGYGPWVYCNVTDEYFPEGYRAPLYTHEYLTSIAEDLQTPYPWKGGIVGLVRWFSPNPGVKFIPVGPTAEAVGDPFYFDAATKQYSLELEATTYYFGLPDAPLAEGGFTEVVPGVQQFEFVGTAGDCPHASWGWPGDAPNRLRVLVMDGYTTYGSVRCDEEIPGRSLDESSASTDSDARE